MSEGADVRRISLPIFSSDSGKDIPNYLRASAGSCHDFCKYGKDATAVKQNHPWNKKIVVTPPNVVLSKLAVPVVKKAKVARIQVSELEKGKHEFLPEAKMSAASFKSSEEKIKHSEGGVPIYSKAKLVKEKSLTRKTAATSSSSKSEKLKRDAKIVKKRNEGRKHDMATESPKALHTHPPTKPYAITRPPSSPSLSKLATKAKTPTVKGRPQSLGTQLKARSVGESSSPSSAAKMLKTATVKTLPPLNPPWNAKIKKASNIKDQNVKKGNASKARVSEDVATRRSSVSYKFKTASNLKRKELQMEKQVEAEIAETKDFYEEKKDQGSHAGEFENQKEMESYGEVPEKILYVIQMKTVDNSQPPSRVEREILDMQPLPSFSQDDSAYTESEEGSFRHEDGHLGERLYPKAAEKIKLKKSDAVSSQENVNKDPVKLKFRRGTVVDITQEKNGPIRLKFKREQQTLEQYTANDVVRKNSFKLTEATQNKATADINSRPVFLRHQDVQDKKDAQGLFNNVIEETASKLVETRKSKVKALVGAFETVISLQDGKPAATR